MQSCNATIAFLLLAALLPRGVLIDSAVVAFILVACVYIRRGWRRAATLTLERDRLLYLRTLRHFQGGTRVRMQDFEPMQRRVIALRYKALRRSSNAHARKRCMLPATAIHFWAKLIDLLYVRTIWCQSRFLPRAPGSFEIMIYTSTARPTYASLICTLKRSFACFDFYMVHGTVPNTS